MEIIVHIIGKAMAKLILLLGRFIEKVEDTAAEGGTFCFINSLCCKN